MDTSEKVNQAFRALQFNTCLNMLARIKQTAYYIDLESVTGILCASKELSRLLDQSMEEDRRMGKPFRSALIVSKETGMPGEGFFKKARQWDGAFVNDEELYWKNCLKAMKCEHLLKPEFYETLKRIEQNYPAK